MAIQVVWVEVPVKDIDRAAQFYRAVFDISYEIVDDGVRRTATLTNADVGSGFSLNQTKDFEPSDKGPLAYLDAGDDLNAILPKVEPAGGKVIAPKTSMGAAGNYALIQDTEGNVLALYSPN